MSENLSEDSVPLYFVHELASDLSLQHFLEKTTQHSTIVVEALERDFLCDIVRGVRHCWKKVAS